MTPSLRLVNVFLDRSFAISLLWDEARDTFEEALQLTGQWPLRRAHVLHELGVMHAAKGESEEARVRFLDALVIFRQLGAQLYVPRTEACLPALPSA